MVDYAFVTRWFLDAPLDQVYAAIDDAPRWPTWWKAVVAVDVVQVNDANGAAAVARTVWRTALLYRFRFDARLVHRVPPRIIEIVSSGELAGTGRWELAPEGAGTLVTYSWNVRTTKRWMNALAPVLRGAFAYNHRVVMRAGGEGLGRLLGAHFEDRSPA